MKIYRDMRYIVENFFPVIMIGIVIPVMIWPMLSMMLQDKATAGLSALLVLVLFCCIAVALYLVFVWLVHLCGIRKATIEVTDNGIRYPYLLKNNLEITWEQIKNFEYVEDRVGKHTNYYIVVELKNGVELGSFKYRPGLGLLKSVQKKYDHQIIIFFKDIVKDYNLSDLADLLNAERKRKIAPLEFIHNIAPVLYKKSDESLGDIFKKMIVMSIAFLAVPAFFMIGRGYANTDKGLFIIFGVVMAIAILKILCDRFFELLTANIAINFDQMGITSIDDKLFDQTVMWHDVKNVYIEELVERKTGKKIPILMIELPNKTYRIHNKLKDISIYELYEVIKHHLGSGSNSPS